jgi:hypothetical protein
MFWPVILPFQLTIVFWLALAVCTVIFSLNYGYRVRKAALLLCIGLVVLFLSHPASALD